MNSWRKTQESGQCMQVNDYTLRDMYLFHLVYFNMETYSLWRYKERLPVVLKL